MLKSLVQHYNFEINACNLLKKGAFNPVHNYYDKYTKERLNSTIYLYDN